MTRTQNVKRAIALDARGARFPEDSEAPVAVARAQVALALGFRPAGLTIYADRDEHVFWNACIAGAGGRAKVGEGAPEEGFVLRADRFYDPGKLRKAFRTGADPESSALWRLDSPERITAARDELVKRAGAQPLGRFWALEPACRLAEALAPTRLRPNHLTLASTACVLGAAALVAWGPGAV